MSIIHEALKKVQSNRSETKTLKDQAPPATAKSTPLPTGKATAPATPKPATLLGSSLWAAVIIILCGFTFYNLYELKTRKNELLAAKVPPVIEQALPAPITNAVVVTPIVPPPPPPVKPKKGEILLSGIVLMDGKNFALINKEFYEVGEKVEGATITKITDDSIDILQKGKTRTIKVIRPE